MDQKEFEDKLDGYAERISQAAGESVKKVEEAFDKGKANLKEDMETRSESRFRSSPRMGAILFGVGLVWLLASTGFINHPIVPILLIAVGIFLLVRQRR